MPNGLTPIATPPKTLEELQQAVSTPKRGYDIHHIVEQTRAEQDGFARSQIDAPENLVRIPTYKHWDINAWFQTKNKQYDDASPREYLRDKGWDERLRVGKQALTDHGVLKPWARRFTIIALGQDEALLTNEIAKFNRLYDSMDAVEAELQGRAGDQRQALVPLLGHPNAQVRLKTAIATLGVAPQAARKALQTISDRDEYPQAANARGMMRALDEGTFTPN
jgi:hypothetical protein